MQILIYLAILISSTSAYDWIYDSWTTAQFVIIRQSCREESDRILGYHIVPTLLTMTKSGFSYLDAFDNLKTVSAAGMVDGEPSQVPINAYRPDSNTNFTILVGDFTYVSNFKYGLTDLQTDITLTGSGQTCVYRLSALNSVILQALTPFLLCLVVCLVF